jgi:hypothetical protein
MALSADGKKGSRHMSRREREAAYAVRQIRDGTGGRAFRPRTFQKFRKDGTIARLHSVRNVERSSRIAALEESE